MTNIISKKDIERYRALLRKKQVSNENLVVPVYRQKDQTGKPGAIQIVPTKRYAMAERSDKKLFVAPVGRCHSRCDTVIET